MKVIVTLKNETNGYWDGGLKKRFEIELDKDLNNNLNIKHDSKGKFIKVHCYGANHWWHCALGKTEKQTLSYAVRYFNKKLIEKIEYVN